jgi:Bifunctional DNA primase/polymerase, N-terminal
MRPDVIRAMRELLAARVSVVPIRPDGSKAALVAWRQYQLKRATDMEFADWVTHLKGTDAGLAIVAGKASGNAEDIDFDDAALADPWAAMVEQIEPGLVGRLVAVRTPRPGMSFWYRCPAVQGNQKLAQALDTDGKPKTLIETRGLGGYAIIPPSPPACHPLHKPYVLVRGDLTKIPEITPDERDILLNAARTFNTYVNPVRIVASPPPRPTDLPGDRPGDLFAASVSWHALLEPHGWVCVGGHNGYLLWRRPGKARGWSATSGLGDTDLLYVFSTNAAPFEADMLYSKFGAYSVLAHGGDFSAAARALAILGYRRSRLSALRSGY